MDQPDYSSEFSDESFWAKLGKTAKLIGRDLVEKVLTMYFAALDKDTPLWAKTILIAALGYFICPIDAIPDAIPVAGYADDAGAIAVALAAVAVHIKPEHVERAKKKADDWFGADEKDV